MSGLEQITNTIIKNAQLNADKIIEDAKIKADEIINQSEKYREDLKEKNENSIKAEVNDIKNKAYADEKRIVKNCELTLKNKIIDEIFDGAELKIKNMNKKEYQELLGKFLEKVSKAVEGTIYFSKEDEDRIDKAFINKYMTKNKNLKAADEFSDKILSGFVIENDKININCSIEALFLEKKNELTDYINSLIHFL